MSNAYLRDGIFPEIWKKQELVQHPTVLRRRLYVLYTSASDGPTTSQAMTSTFGHDTAILRTPRDLKMATTILQRHIDAMEVWLKTGE